MQFVLASRLRFFTRPVLLGSRTSLNSVVGQQARCFSQSRPRQASENQDSFLTDYQNTPLFRQLADKPEALKALNDFAKMLQEQGIDISSSVPPSRTQIIRLAASAKFRDGAKKVMVELRNAGLDFSSKDAMEELMKLSRGSKPDQD